MPVRRPSNKRKWSGWNASERTSTPVPDTIALISGPVQLPASAARRAGAARSPAAERCVRRTFATG